MNRAPTWMAEGASRHPAIERFSAAALANDRQIRALYLFGSAVDGTALPSSDIDLFVVVRGDPPPEELAVTTSRLRTIAEAIDDATLDLVVIAEAELRRDGHFRIERASRLVAGEDIRADLPPTTLDAFIRHYGEAPLTYMAILRPGARLTPPLAYPDPAGEFFGYDSRTLPPAGIEAHNIRGLVSLVCWIATIRIALKRGVMVASKGESARIYAMEIGDEWTDLIASVYRYGHDRWYYLVPEDPTKRRLLRSLCGRTLRLENHYLTITSQV